MDNIYDIFMLLPIFQGVSKSKILELVEKNRFHFLKYKAGDKLVSKGEECVNIKFLIRGDIRMEILNKGEKIKIVEVLTAPDVLAPYHMFGRSTFYPGDIYAETEVGIMQIDKASFFSIMQGESIFMLNMLNMMSRRAQKTMESFLALSSGDMREKFALWVLSITQYRSKSLKIQCKQKDLYSIFGVQRSIFIGALDQLVEEGVLTYTTREISILQPKKLIEILDSDAYNTDGITQN